MTPKNTALIVIILTVAGFAASAAVLIEGWRESQSPAATLPSTGALPSDCVRPAGGFLIIASKYGYNDSVLEGSGPSKAWPVINVIQGQTVKITVCNVDDTQSHGFQVGSYFDSNVESIAPGKVITVTFVATDVGTFPIYCAIFCSIHLFMESGQLRVDA